MSGQDLARELLERFQLALEAIRKGRTYREFKPPGIWEVSTIDIVEGMETAEGARMVPTGRVIVSCVDNEAMSIFIAAMRQAGHMVIPLRDRNGVIVDPRE